MNCIVVDDDKLSRLVLEKFIARTDGLELRASLSSAVDAANLLSNENNVDLVFLDIEMPEMNGIEFLSNLKNLPQVIIFSSKEKYALAAFDFDVTDYLLKPIEYPRFYKAAQKARRRHTAMHFDSVVNDEIFIKKGANLLKMRFSEILWVEALENYVILNTKTDKFTIHFTMKAIENKLPRPVFTRIHRSYIVNTKSISVIKDNAVEIEYDDITHSLPIGKSYKDNLLKDINLMIK
jgi:DNA-binding LytR/AlgR family response regulator